MENIKEVKYAGFWVRTLAFIIDGFILGLICILPLNAINVLFGKTSWVSIIVLLTILGAYYSYTIYKWRGTIGKKILGLEVLDKELNPLSLKHSSIRFASSLITYLILFSPQLLIALLSSVYYPLGFLAFIVVLFPILIMFTNNKRQVLHDLFAKTIVVDAAFMSQKREQYSEKEEQIKLPKKIVIVRGIGILIIVAIGSYSLYTFTILTYVYSSLYSHNKNKYDNSFHEKYKTNDYNNSKIIFYKKELEKYSMKFIEADGKYDIFEADVKKDLALNCLKYFLREHNETNWIDQGSKFRKNARNKYAITEAKIEKAKENEDYMGKNFYFYDLNDVNHIEDDIANVWGKKDKNKETCQKSLSAHDMYQIFIYKYMKNREEQLDRDIIESKITTRGGVPDKSFYLREVKETTEWLKMLYEKYPEYLEKKKKKEKAMNIEYQIILKEEVIENKKEKLEEKVRGERAYQDELKNAKHPIFTTIRYYKNEDLDNILWGITDFEIKDSNGHTPLYVAVNKKNIYAVKTLLENGANMYAIDSWNIYNVFTEAAHTNDVEIMKIFLENGADINYQYKKSKTALTISTIGCKNFKMLKFLMENGADSNLEDAQGYTTKTILPGYCSKNKENYQKMMDLIESKESFFSW